MASVRAQAAHSVRQAPFRSDILTIDGGILLVGERLRRRDAVRALAERKGEVTVTDVLPDMSRLRWILQVVVQGGAWTPWRSAKQASSGWLRSLPSTCRYQPLRYHHGGRASEGTRPRGRGALLVLARNSDYPRRRALESTGPDGLPRQGCARPDLGGTSLRRSVRVICRCVSSALLRDQDAHAFRHLLPRRRSCLDHPVRLSWFAVTWFA